MEHNLTLEYGALIYGVVAVLVYYAYLWFSEYENDHGPAAVAAIFWPLFAIPVGAIAFFAWHLKYGLLGALATYVMIDGMRRAHRLITEEPEQPEEDPDEVIWREDPELARRLGLPKPVLERRVRRPGTNSFGPML